MKLIIGNKNYSSWSLRPWLLLSAYNLEFEEIRVPLDLPDTQRELSKYTEAAKVPVLHDGELIVWDSMAICEYICEKYLDNQAWPADLAARAEARACCAEMHSGFFTLRNDLPMNCRATNRCVEISAELQLEINRVESIWATLRSKYADLGPWLMGGFSIVDCMYAPVVFRLESYAIPVSDSTRSYMETLLSHPAVERWLTDAINEVEIIKESELGLQDSV